MALIELKGISHSYVDGVNVLDGVCLGIERGEFVSILGASGSGKTTLLSIMGGIEKPKQGKVYIDGEDITAYSESKLAVLRRTKLSFVFQFFNLASYLTVEQNILVPALLQGKSRAEVASDLDRLLEYTGLTGRRKALPARISGGEQQRAAIARGLIVKPEMVFLDEPTGNLDSKNSRDIMELLRKINSEYGVTVVQVTHNEANAGYGTRVVMMRDGKLYSADGGYAYERDSQTHS